MFGPRADKLATSAVNYLYDNYTTTECLSSKVPWLNKLSTQIDQMIVLDSEEEQEGEQREQENEQSRHLLQRLKCVGQR